MSKLFLHGDITLYTCKEESCEQCSASGEIVCHFTGKSLAMFLYLNLPLLILGGFFIARLDSGLFLSWILFMIAYFGFIEIRVMCSHCPHYGEPGLKSLKCWANYGAPKIWKYRPGPMSNLEKVIFLSGLLFIFALPVFPLIISADYIFLGFYVLLLLRWKTGLKTLYCSSCINFACPLNAVIDEVREVFFEKNPVVGRAWKGDSYDKTG